LIIISEKVSSVIFLIVKCVLEFDNIKSIVNLLELKSIELDSKIFEIPKFKKNYKYSKTG